MGGYRLCLDGMNSAVGGPTLTIPFQSDQEFPAALLLVARSNFESKFLKWPNSFSEKYLWVASSDFAGSHPECLKLLFDDCLT